MSMEDCNHWQLENVSANSITLLMTFDSIYNLRHSNIQALSKQIRNGMILKAIEALQCHFPSLLFDDSQREPTELLFSLQCQHFAELVRSNQINQALEYAQKVLGPYAYQHPKTLNSLQDLVALLAYDHPDKSPVSDFLSQSKRDNLAAAVNSAILRKILFDQ